MESRHRRALIRRLSPPGYEGVPDCLPAPQRVVNPETSCMIVNSQLFEAYVTGL
jgi:hypothetical protein